MAAARVSWDELSGSVKVALAWARAVEVGSTHVGTRGLLIGLLRSGEDPANALLRHFGISEHAIFQTLQRQNPNRLDPETGVRPGLDDLPSFTENARACIERGVELRHEIEAAELDVACLLAALLDTRGATARRALAESIREIPIEAIGGATLDWLHTRNMSYAEALERRFPRRTLWPDDGFEEIPEAAGDGGRDQARADGDAFGLLALSDSARDAVGWATALAQRQPEQLLDSTALLCGFVMHAQPRGRDDTSVAVFNDLQAQMKTGKRGIVARLLEYDGALPRGPAGLPPPDLQTDELRRVVGWAIELATSVEAGAEVRVRHLLCALLAPNDRGELPDVVSRLAREGVDDERLRMKLNEAIRTSRPNDDLEFWATLLAGPRLHFVTGGLLAGYDSDDIGTIDRLDIKSDVETLASVLAARAVEPPVSVGLFGDWGTGKSFFMNALEGRIRTLAAATAASSEASAYCSRIKHIRFNAWHYADANLWASLVTEIFDALAASGDERTRAVLAQLDTAKQAREEAETRRDQAVAVRNRLRERVEDLERKGNQPSRLKHTSLVDRAAAPDEVEALLQTVEQKAEPDQRMKLRDISELADDLAGLAGAVSTVIRISGWRRVLLALAAGVLGFVVVQVLWGDAVGTVVGLVSGVGALSSALASPVARARRAAEAAAGAARLIDDEVRRLELELAAQRAEQDRLTQQLIVAESDIVSAEHDVREILGGRLLARFVQERAAADDYRRYLGLVSLIRRDFVTLNALMSEDDDPPFDRIVLYIDDLDRCPPARVVEVLEAVHLLLALRLFVVVVAVDSRWLLRSLEIHYAALRESSRTAGPEDDYWVATPQNYLEKIFQIPYAVRPMAPDGYRSLVHGMLRAEAESALSGGSARDVAGPSGDVTVESGETNGDAGRPAGDEGAATPTESLQPAQPPAQPATDESPLPGLDLAPATLQVTAAELDSIKALAALIRTPRATKRLVNTYRLARASLDSAELALFVGRGKLPGEHRAALILLGVLIGFPTQAADFLQALIDDVTAVGWIEFLEALAAANDDLETLMAAVAQATTVLQPPASLAPFVKWAARVGRYSFHTSRLIVPGVPASPPR